MNHTTEQRIAEAKRICEENGVYDGITLNHFLGITNQLPEWNEERQAKVLTALSFLRNYKKFEKWNIEF